MVRFGQQNGLGLSGSVEDNIIFAHSTSGEPLMMNVRVSEVGTRTPQPLTGGAVTYLGGNVRSASITTSPQTSALVSLNPILDIFGFTPGSRVFVEVLGFNQQTNEIENSNGVLTVYE